MCAIVEPEAVKRSDPIPMTPAALAPEPFCYMRNDKGCAMPVLNCGRLATTQDVAYNFIVSARESVGVQRSAIGLR